MHGQWRFTVYAFNVLLLFQQSGQEFHEDLFPDTAGTTAAMSAEEWWQGGNKQVGGGVMRKALPKTGLGKLFDRWGQNGF